MGRSNISISVYILIVHVIINLNIMWTDERKCGPDDVLIMLCPNIIWANECSKCRSDVLHVMLSLDIMWTNVCNCVLDNVLIMLKLNIIWAHVCSKCCSDHVHGNVARAACSGQSVSMATSQLYQGLSIKLMRANTRALLARVAVGEESTAGGPCERAQGLLEATAV